MLKKHSFLIALGLLLFAMTTVSQAQLFEIAYDDGTPYYYSGRPDPFDTCGVWFEPPTACRLISAKFKFYSPGDVEIWVWKLVDDFDPNNYYDTDEVAGVPGPSPLDYSLIGPIPYTFQGLGSEVWEEIIFSNYGGPPGGINVGTTNFFVGYVLMGGAPNLYDPSIYGDVADTRPYHSLCWLNTPGGAHPLEPGWWAYGIDWMLRCTVDMYGDPPPNITGLEDPPDTYTLGPYPITAHITDLALGGGQGLVTSAELIYSVDGGAEDTLTMASIGNDDWQADIPAVAVNGKINFRVEAEDNATPPSFAVSPDYDGYNFMYRQPTAGATVLLVNDGAGEGTDTLYKHAMDEHGYVYDFWLIDPTLPDDAGIPGFDVINNAYYDHLIWFTGTANVGNLPANDATLSEWPIVSFLDNGGNLLLSTSDYLGGAFGGAGVWTTFVAPTNTFMYDYLMVLDGWSDSHPDAMGESQDSMYTGEVGDPVGGAFSGSWFQNHPDPNYNDFINPRMGAYTCFRTQIDDESAGIRYAGDYALVFLPWILEACDDTTITKNIVISALDWFVDTTGVKPLNTGGVPLAYDLEQNYPNPFNPTTNIRFSLPKTSHVKLTIYNALDQEVATLVEGEVTAGAHVVNWEASNVAAGVYFYKLEIDNFQSAKKMVLVK